MDDKPSHSSQLIYEISILLNTLRDSIEDEAADLVTNFIRQRSRLQKTQMDLTPISVALKRKLRTTYAPLCLMTRVNKGSLEIRWFLTHHSPRTVVNVGNNSPRHYQSVPSTTSKGPTSYTSRTLSKYARSWELELVLATERRAFELRQLRADVTVLSRILLAISRRRGMTPAPSAVMASEAQGIEIRDDATQPSIYDNPNVAPQPPQHRGKTDKLASR